MLRVVQGPCYHGSMVLCQTVSSGYPNPTRYPVFHLLPDPTRFSFENHRVAGNPKYRVFPSGKPGVSGITRYLYTRKYPTYPEIPESKKDTRKYPIVYFDTPTRPEPDPLPGILSNTRPAIEKPYPLGTDPHIIDHPH